MVTALFENRPATELRSLANKLRNKPSMVAVLATFDGAKLSMVAACADDTNVDARELLNNHLAPIGAAAVAVQPWRKAAARPTKARWKYCSSKPRIISMSLRKLNEEIIACRKCPRLVEWREEVSRTKRKAYMDWEYWGKPVPGFGDPNARVLVVGLAPGAHGSNRTGRQFTGDASGNFLFPALHRAGFASQPESTSRDDDLKLKDMYITASGRCAPPKNKPTAEELNNCQPFLEREIDLLQPKVIVCLGPDGI